MVMNNILLDELRLKDLPPEKRILRCEEIIKTEKDESLRWDAVWISGELADDRLTPELYDRVSDLMGWILQNDKNGVVKHEACYQIAARNMRSNIPVLIHSALNDPSILTKHEAIESLGLMRAFEAEDLIKQALKDPSPDVRETAEFVIKRLSRIKELGAYDPSETL